MNLKPTFILVKEKKKNLSIIRFVSFLSLLSGKHKTLMYSFDLLPNYKSCFFARHSLKNKVL